MALSISASSSRHCRRASPETALPGGGASGNSGWIVRGGRVIGSGRLGIGLICRTTPERIIVIKEPRELRQRRNSDDGLGSLGQTLAVRRVQHPRGQRALGAVGQPDYHRVGKMPVAVPNDLDCLAAKGMKPVMNAAKTRNVSSM